jgi:hypothetical protein
MGRPKKEGRLTVKIDKDLLTFFSTWCHENQDTMSGYIKRHILDIKRKAEASKVFSPAAQEQDRQI